MFKQNIILFILCSLSFFAQAQSFQITGTVQDASGQRLSGATVVLLQAQDSVLEHFVITDELGDFDFRKVNRGEYLLQISFLGYENHETSIALYRNLNYDNMILTEESKVLKEINVEAERIPILIKNDTIEYNADAFPTKPNAVVEDLLKRLPGVEIGRNGTIRAQGEEVNRILVDGKEFFGNDASIATQNLPADAIDKVQVFDKKSDAAEFTGMDDGERDKTINLTLKEDKKKGYFGSVTAGYGTDDRYEAKGNINRFAPNLQISAIGRSNNINEQGFSIEDYIEFMGGIQALTSVGGVLNPQDLGIPISGDSRSNGFLDTHVGGLNLNYDFSKKTDWHLSYFYNDIQQEIDRIATRQNLLSARSTFNTQQKSQRHNTNRNHRVNTEFKHKIDSTQDLKWRSDFSFINTKLNYTAFSETFDNDNDLENSSRSNYLTQNDRLTFNSNLTYRKRFGKIGRALVSDFGIGKFGENGTSRVSFLNQFPDLEERIEQDQIRANDQFNYSVKLNYSEPLGNGKFLQFTYRRQDYVDELNKDFFDLVNNEPFFNTLLSNYFTKDYVYDRAGLSFQYNQKKSKFSLGLDAQQSSLKGSLRSEDTPIQRSFQNLLPNARWQYDFNSYTNLSLNYRSNIQEPSLEQLQPIVDNSDPLSIYIGNPDLQAESRHTLGARFSLFDQFSFTNLFAFFNFTYTENKITTARSVDALLRQEIRPINVENDFTAFGSINFGTPIRKIKSQINLTHRFQYNRAILFVNDLENITDRWNGELDLSIENRKKEVIDIRIGGSLGYNLTNYSVSEELNQSFFNQTYYADVNWNIKDQWNINSVFDFTIYQADIFNPKEYIPIWQASISRLFGEKKQFELRLSAFDLLNQNIGINRNSSSNFVQTEQIRSLGQYFMLSGIYSIKGFRS